MTRITSRHSHGDISPHQGDPFLGDETTYILAYGNCSRKCQFSIFVLWYNNHSMNKEEKNKRLAQIRRLEGLLAYAIKHNEVEEIERLRKALDAIIATL